MLRDGGCGDLRTSSYRGAQFGLLLVVSGQSFQMQMPDTRTGIFTARIVHQATTQAYALCQQRYSTTRCEHSCPALSQCGLGSVSRATLGAVATGKDTMIERPSPPRREPTCCVERDGRKSWSQLCPAEQYTRRGAGSRDVRRLGLVSHLRHVRSSPARASARSALWAPGPSVRVLGPPVTGNLMWRRNDKFLAPCSDILRSRYCSLKRILASASLHLHASSDTNNSPSSRNVCIVVESCGLRDLSKEWKARVT